VEGGAAHQLHVEVAHAERALGGLANRGESLGQQIVERLAVAVAFAQFDGLVLQLVVGELGEVVFQMVDGFCIVLEATKESSLTYAKCAFENVGHDLLQRLLSAGLSARGHTVAPAVTGS
jgi:hypothetical protein